MTGSPVSSPPPAPARDAAAGAAARGRAGGRLAAFFDMDGTVLRIDSGISWMRFLYRRRELSHVGMARALYWSLLYKLALLDMETLAHRLARDLEGESVSEMTAKCRLWYESDVAHQVALRAERAIARHRQRRDLLVLLTGSTQFVAEAVAGALGFEHTLCSHVEVNGDQFTGRISQLCFGVHKVAVAEDFARGAGIDLDRSVFYSDSYNDLPMLERVGRPVAVNPDARLWRHARAAGWTIERWR